MAHIFVITPQKSIHKAKIDKNITKVHKGFSSKNAASKVKFFDAVISRIEGLFTGENKPHYEKVQCVVIGSPGFVRENFKKHITEQSIKK